MEGGGMRARQYSAGARGWGWGSGQTIRFPTLQTDNDFAEPQSDSDQEGSHKIMHFYLEFAFQIRVQLCGWVLLIDYSLFRQERKCDFLLLSCATSLRDPL